MREDVSAPGSDEILPTRGGTGDIQGCLDIARELPEFFTPEAITAMVKDLSTEELYLARAGSIVGFACVKRKSPQVSEILWMAVKRSLTGRGIGTLLLEDLCRRLKLGGAALLVVKTLAPDVSYAPYALTRRFYEKNGFLLVEVVDPYPGWDPGNPCAVYVRIL